MDSDEEAGGASGDRAGVRTAMPRNELAVAAGISHAREMQIKQEIAARKSYFDPPPPKGSVAIEAAAKAAGKRQELAAADPAAEAARKRRREYGKVVAVAAQPAAASSSISAAAEQYRVPHSQGDRFVFPASVWGPSALAAVASRRAAD